jgi:hypothetical protein
VPNALREGRAVSVSSLPDRGTTLWIGAGAGCRVDFGVVPKNLNVLRVSCLIAVQSNQAPALVSDFELGHVSSDQNNYTLGQYLAPLQLLNSGGPDQFYIANAATLHAVPTGYRPSILVVTRIIPSVPITMQCSIHGTTN